MCGRGVFLIYALSLRLPCSMNKIKKKKKKIPTCWRLRIPNVDIPPSIAVGLPQVAWVVTRTEKLV